MDGNTNFEFIGFEVMLMFPFVFQGHGKKMLGYLLVQRMWLARLRENAEAELMGQFSELRQQVFRRSPEVGEPTLHSLILVVKLSLFMDVWDAH